MRGAPHGGVFELHGILEERVTEDTAGVLRLPPRQGSAGLVEVHHDQRGVADLTAVLRDLEAHGTRTSGSRTLQTFTDRDRWGAGHG